VKRRLFRLAFGLLAMAGLTIACRVGPFAADAHFIPDDDAGPIDLGPALEAGPSVVCDLFLGNCPHQEGCYTDETFSGATVCSPFAAGEEFVRGPCDVQSDCMAGSVCLQVTGEDGKICLELCHTDLPGSSCLDVNSTRCVPLAKYPGIGYCF
jgi:hypothetical protein